MDDSGPILFFASWPGTELRQRITELQAAVRLNARATVPQSLHMTLAFLGRVPRERIDLLKESVSGLTFPDCEIVLDRLGWFESARVVWLGSSQKPLALDGFHDSLAATLEHYGFKVDRKPFVPHITLYRNLRKPPGMMAFEPIRWNPGRFYLVESKRGANAARYEKLAAW